MGTADSRVFLFFALSASLRRVGYSSHTRCSPLYNHGTILKASTALAPLARLGASRSSLIRIPIPSISAKPSSDPDPELPIGTFNVRDIVPSFSRRQDSSDHPFDRYRNLIWSKDSSSGHNRPPRFQRELRRKPTRHLALPNPCTLLRSEHTWPTYASPPTAPHPSTSSNLHCRTMPSRCRSRHRSP